MITFHCRCGWRGTAEAWDAHGCPGSIQDACRVEATCDDQDTLEAIPTPSHGAAATIPMSLPKPEEVMTPDAVAAVLAIPRKTVISLCADGRLEGAFKAGRQWRIPGRALRNMAGAS